MKACMTLLDDQIVQLHRFREFDSDMEPPKRMEQYDALMASVARSTSLARQLNARASETLHERASRRTVHPN